jgi:hypothetical protein
MMMTLAKDDPRYQRMMDFLQRQVDAHCDGLQDFDDFDEAALLTHLRGNLADAWPALMEDASEDGEPGEDYECARANRDAEIRDECRKAAGQSAEPTFDEALADYTEKLQAAQQECSDSMGGAKNMVTILAKAGRRYVKVYRENSLDFLALCSLVCFVNKDTGDIWKAASWKKPALNFPRGNIYNLKGHTYPQYGY